MRVTVAVTVTLTLTCYIQSDVYHGRVLVHFALIFTFLFFSTTTEWRETRGQTTDLWTGTREEKEQRCIVIVVVTPSSTLTSTAPQGELTLRKNPSSHGLGHRYHKARPHSVLVPSASTLTRDTAASAPPFHTQTKSCRLL